MWQKLRIVWILLLIQLYTSSAFAADFSLKSPAFGANQKIPNFYTCEGNNISPPLSWENAPANTKSFVVTLLSSDWVGYNVYLWIIYNIPSQVFHLDKGSKNLPPEALTINNFFDQPGYRGPCPPDAALHHYLFTIYALDTILDRQPEDIEVPAFLNAIKPHVLKQASFTALFSH